MTTTKFTLDDSTKLDPTVAQAWVAGWINGGSSSFQVLQSTGAFGGSGPTGVPFYLVSSVPQVTCDATVTGDNRLLFVVSPTQPTALAVQPGASSPTQYTGYPYWNPPGVAAPGPFDIFEFTVPGQDDLSAVNGFGLNLSFAVSGSRHQRFGVSNMVTRRQVGEAYKAFIKNEAQTRSSALAFAKLLYNGPINASAPAPPSVDNQFFAICDPNDMLVALTQNYGVATNDPLAHYWDSTLAAFFTTGNHLSINLSSNPPAPNIYSGQCTGGPGAEVYTLSNGTNTYTFANPLNTNPLGFAGGQYVFEQSFTTGPAPDQGLLQDNIWMALCRGVANRGVSKTPITNAESTTHWNNPDNWYKASKDDPYVYDVYAKFLHYSNATGGDSRTGGSPIFVGNAAYAFGEDEDPDGPYTGPNVPSKTPADVPNGATLIIHVGRWG